MNKIVEHALFISSCYSTEIDTVDNAELNKHILSLESQSPSASKSNRGGWQSQPFYEGALDSDIVKDLFKQLLPAAQTITDSWKLGVKLKSFNYWYNVNRRNNYNAPHSHPISFISGVYYSKVPKDSGSIVFVRSENETDRMHFQTTYIADNNLTVDDPRVNTDHWFQPKEGLLLLFPGHLKHSVDQNLTDDKDDARISLSFNFF